MAIPKIMIDLAVIIVNWNTGGSTLFKRVQERTR